METQTPAPPLKLKRVRPREPVVPICKKKDPDTPEHEAWVANMMAEVRAGWEKSVAEAKDDLDIHAMKAIEFRQTWIELWSHCFGDFEDTTKIRPMRFTDNPGPPFVARLYDTAQIISVKVAGVRGGLQWPLHVFGIVSLRDAVDNNRNVIFSRKRDNCQILTQKEPYLTLTGPSRAVVMLRPVTFEVELTVKGASESEDKGLSSLAVQLVHPPPLSSCLFNRGYTSKLSTVEFMYGHLCYSLEATISVRVINGSWNGSHCQFFARTASIDEEIQLLDSGDEAVPISDDGKINLSREVVSVELQGKLKVCVKAWNGDVLLVRKEKVFTPKEAKRSKGFLNVGFCKMEVTVAWSLISAELPAENSP